ncbi:HGGxSTG domain-containing protein [Blastococcus goldschmidtiae]|uniref:HGGxSTG domain-containing protein n=1 Tax=Blastococcus goldschmidtiae TaxID=3075546 RepID=A0ABU2K952_9ACTN|nr:HGGxSTG domain-containing protein [Blastococcus sp. DSM 46792]MDT0276712.1 HGGxSTG domain-containing protein [Blastococcus sp. DSM 46792]
MGTRDPKCTEAGCRFIAVPDQDVCIRHGGVVQVRPVGTAPMDHMPLCGATRRDGGLCRQPRMKGATRCRIHGGSTPQVRRKAQEVVAQSIIEQNARYYGRPRSISAVDALTEELHRAQGHVDWLGTQLAARPQDANLLAVYAAERGHLAKLADAMVRAKVDDRRTVLTEQMIEGLDLALTRSLQELGHDPNSPVVRKVVARHLRGISGPGRSPEVTAMDAEVVSDYSLPEPVPF